MAFIVIRTKVSGTCKAIFDHEHGKQFEFNGLVRPEHISVYDFARKCHIGGQKAGQTDSGDYYSIYDFGDGRHLTLSFKDEAFHGYDHKVDKAFSGEVSGNSVTLRDEEANKEFYYSI